MFSFIKMPGATSENNEAQEINENVIGEAMDDVDPKQAKKKFKDRSDKDIDNDGDVDSSDKYLHKRRKAISKANSTEDEPEGENGETATMNPKVSDKPKKKESKIREALMSVIENRAKHTKGATPPEEMDSKDSPSAKKMKDDHKIKVDDTEKLGHDDAAAAGRAGPSKKPRSNDSKIGDKQIINRVAKAYKEMKEPKNDKESA